MASTLLLRAAALALGGSYVEKKLLPDSITSFFDEPSSTIYGLPRSFGLVLFMLILTSFWLIYYGFTVVGPARKKYMERAKKDGEANVEQRYSLPNLYVDGNTAPARAFNCVQRSHQQALETLPQYYLMALISGLSFPLTTALTCAMWLYARSVWATGYAASEGDPGKRYTHPMSRFVWIGLLAVFFMSLMTTVNIFLEGIFQFW